LLRCANTASISHLFLPNTDTYTEHNTVLLLRIHFQRRHPDLFLPPKRLPGIALGFPSTFILKKGCLEKERHNSVGQPLDSNYYSTSADGRWVPPPACTLNTAHTLETAQNPIIPSVQTCQHPGCTL